MAMRPHLWVHDVVRIELDAIVDVHRGNGTKFQYRDITLIDAEGNRATVRAMTEHDEPDNLVVRDLDYASRRESSEHERCKEMS